MATTHHSLHYHVVFSTKNREPWMAPTPRCDLHEYLGGIVRKMDASSHGVGGTGDHVHLLMALKPTHCLANVMRDLKADSSSWFRTKFDLAGFAWQNGYGAFTVGAGDLDRVKAYVLSQEKHHQTRSFQEEYVAMLERGLVEYDDQYLW